MNMTTANDQWQVANQAYLTAALAQLREALKHHADLSADFNEEPATQNIPTLNPPELAILEQVPPALEHLCQTFGLSEFERNVLLLCAGVELDASFPLLCAAAQGDAQRTYPTFSLALALLPSAHWSALTPVASLRRWRLIELGGGNLLTTSPLRVDERILHYLVGVSHLDERLAGILEPLTPTEELVESHVELAERLLFAWVQEEGATMLPLLQLCGFETVSKRAIAATACNALGLNLYSIAAHALPTSTHDLTQFIALWEREAILERAALLVDCDDLEGSDPTREAAIARLCETFGGPLIISTTQRRRIRLRPMLAFEVARPHPDEQQLVWESTLGDVAELVNGQVKSLVTQFSLSSSTIQAVCLQAQAEWEQELLDDEVAAETEADLLARCQTAFQHRLWETCRAQARPRLDDLAQRIETHATWNDLVLPETQLQVLLEMAAHVRQRSKVYGEWGFAGRSARGLGISALFAGPSGTGKTMAAEVIARELKLDLYRIDLSQVVSKYIGETEKNLARVFDAAEMGGAILLFDEADALFGKRTEVKDSHDRHANVEVSYLLQRMEEFRGLSILTTNLKNALDQAFLRRLRFVVQFTFPDSDQRAEIWRRIFPDAMPQSQLDFKKLGQLNVAGGNIRNIALNAAFIAADADQPVGMRHVLFAAKAEYMKLERPLTDAEVRSWV